MVRANEELTAFLVKPQRDLRYDAAWQISEPEVLTAAAIFVKGRGYAGSQRLSDSVTTSTPASREYRRFARYGHGGNGPRSHP